MSIEQPKQPKRGLNDVFQEKVVDRMRSPFEIEREEAWGHVEPEHQGKRVDYPDSVGTNEPI